MNEKKAGVGNVGEEEFAQLEVKHLTREDVRRQAYELFKNSESWAEESRATLKKLFVQAEAADSMSLGVTKVASATEAFFAEHGQTLAQRRYPELLKVAGAPGPGTRPSPNLKARAGVGQAKSGTNQGAPAVASPLSGGAA